MRIAPRIERTTNDDSFRIVNMFWILHFTLLLLRSIGAEISSEPVAYRWRLSPDPERHSVGFRLVNSGSIQTLTGHQATVVTQCALACLKRQLCRSFNFSSRRRTCELNARAHDSLDLGPADDEPEQDSDKPELDSDEEFAYFTRDALQPEVSVCDPLTTQIIVEDPLHTYDVPNGITSKSH